MLLNRQHPSEVEPRPPQNSTSEKYGQPHCDISGKLYCTDKNGNIVSLCSTSNFSEQSNNSLKVNNYSVNKDVPSSAVFSDYHYQFLTGNTQGTFSVKTLPTGDTQEKESSQEIKINGLGTAAYHSEEDFASKNDLRNIDANSLGGSSLQDIIDFVKNYVDNKEVFP